jgi:hypothetical protein
LSGSLGIEVLANLLQEGSLISSKEKSPNNSEKEIASFFGRVYWFAPFGALASYGVPPDDLHYGRSETRFSPYGEGDASASGCLTSKDEERETWTAESLRVSITRKLRLSKG